MHVLLVADGRSPITRRWVNGLAALQHEVTLVSTFPCPSVEGARETYVLPVAFAGMAGSQAGGAAGTPGVAKRRKVISRARSSFLAARYVLGPLSIPFYAGRFRALLRALRPDLVHALRIPFEGMLASYTPPGTPLLLSIWGNDLTLHADGSDLMGAFTARALRRANGLLADTNRDIRLSKQWGFPEEGATLAVPGAGGIDLLELYRADLQQAQDSLPGVPEDAPLVINPRGFRPGSVCNDTFFQAIPLILQRRPDVHFLCAAMAGQPEAMQWVQRCRIMGSTHLLPYLAQPQLWHLFKRSQITVSVSEHDGTPNSLLEAMACGCFPIAGDIESLREWITPGVNGLLVEPGSPQALAEAVLLALDNSELRSGAAEYNLEMIRERAEAGLVRSQVECFYRRFVPQALPSEDAAAGATARIPGED